MKNISNTLLLSEKPTLKIPEKCWKDIEYLLNSTPYAKEWSAVVFYKMKGDLNDVSNMVMEVVEIYPMNIHSSTFTSFESNKHDMERFSTYILDRKEIYKGGIHSHHNMSVFFSGTDMKDLETAAQGNNVYLSIIVNNKREVIAKISYIVDINTKEYLVKVKGKKGNDLDPININFTQEESSLLVTHDCIVKRPTLKGYVPDAHFLEAYERVTKEYNTPTFPKYGSNSMFPRSNPQKMIGSPASTSLEFSKVLLLGTSKISGINSMSVQKALSTGLQTLEVPNLANLADRVEVEFFTLYGSYFGSTEKLESVNELSNIIDEVVSIYKKYLQHVKDLTLLIEVLESLREEETDDLLNSNPAMKFFNP